MRDEKEERKKQARSNKQTRQSNTAYVLYMCIMRFWSGEELNVYEKHTIMHSHTDSAPPEVSRCSRLLSLATITQQSPWDLVAMLARVDSTPAFLQRVLTHYQADYQKNSSTMAEHFRRHYLTTCSLVHRWGQMYA